jgi:hypothetical protein
VFDPKWQSSGLKMMEFSNSVISDQQNHLDLTSVITGHATRATDVAEKSSAPPTGTRTGRAEVEQALADRESLP